MIRLMALAIVREEGLSAVQAANAAEALALLETDPSIAVLFTDIEMPGDMDGLQLAERVHLKWPGVQLILTSGRVQLSRKDIPDDSTFLPKPYAAEDLTAVIREMLDRPSRTPKLSHKWSETTVKFSPIPSTERTRQNGDFAT